MAESEPRFRARWSVVGRRKRGHAGELLKVAVDECRYAFGECSRAGGELGDPVCRLGREFGWQVLGPDGSQRGLEGGDGGVELVGDRGEGVSICASWVDSVVIWGRTRCRGVRRDRRGLLAQGAALGS